MSAGQLLFTISSYGQLASAIAAHGEFERGEIESRRFPDGEHYLRIATSVGRRDCVLVGGTISDEATLELYDIACTIVEGGARSLTLVVPYFGCSTMERVVRPGEAVTAKTRARLLSSIPRAPQGNRIELLDLHSEGIPYYFEGALRSHHLYAKPVIAEAVRRLGGDDFVLACTDAGRAKWVESLANDLHVDASFVFKRRIDGEHTVVTAVSAHVTDRPVVIYDDMIRTGSSLIGAARAYLEAGASRVSAIATHGLFPGDSLAKLQQTGLFDRIVVTDSHPRALSLAGDFLEITSVAGLLANDLAAHAP